MDISALIITGLAIGFLSSFFGIGGGSLIVPVLYSLYPSMVDEQVIAISLLTIFIMASGNTYKFYKSGVFPSKITIYNFLISAGLGAFIGSFLTFIIDTDLSKKIIAIILLLTVVKLFLYKPDVNLAVKKYSQKKLFITAFLGAFVSSITGLGGGIIFVPMLLSFNKVNSKDTSAYSNLAMLIATLVGVLPHFFTERQFLTPITGNLDRFFIGDVNIAIALALAACSLFTLNLGQKLNQSVSLKTKNLTLALLLLFLSFKLIFL